MEKTLGTVVTVGISLIDVVATGFAVAGTEPDAEIKKLLIKNLFDKL